jgi:hypothetical protein
MRENGVRGVAVAASQSSGMGIRRRRSDALSKVSQAVATGYGAGWEPFAADRIRVAPRRRLPIRAHPAALNVRRASGELRRSELEGPGAIDHDGTALLSLDECDPHYGWLFDDADDDVGALPLRRNDDELCSLSQLLRQFDILRTRRVFWVPQSDCHALAAVTTVVHSLQSTPRVRWLFAAERLSGCTRPAAATEINLERPRQEVPMKSASPMSKG